MNSEDGRPRWPAPVVQLALLLVCFSISAGSPQEMQNAYTVQSPDGKTTARVSLGGSLALTISRSGRTLLTASRISLTIDSRPPLNGSFRVEEARTSDVDEKITPVVPEKRSVIPDQYRQLTLFFDGNWRFTVRAYNDGVAYRFHTSFPKEILVTSEELSVRLAPEDSIWFPEETSFLSHSERLYACLSAASIADTQMCCLPAVVATSSGIKVAITEADLLDYPGLYLKGTGKGSPVLHAVLPAHPDKEEMVGDRTMAVRSRLPYLARTRGTREFPWRVFAIAEQDGQLIENDIVYRLGSPTALKETSWIHPGKVAWDWWNANNVYGVPFTSGVNTATYRYYIDFAAAHRIEYVIFDEGWSKPSDLFQINPQMDMDSLTAHAREKHVGIILWTTWNALNDRMGAALDRFASWGVKGIKVDFMQRDDQKMVNYYETVAREAAKRKLLVDFHGAFKPTGFSRTYPHVLTREGVLGLEHNKWSENVTPRHDVTLPFTRMFAGAMDYTPGAMRNAARGSFRPIFEEPMSQGTRCHQLAMYVVYESPLQMLSDNPSNYEKEPEAMEFLSAVPTTWDETHVLNGKIGQYLTVARRKGDSWYVGAMTDWSPRELTLDLPLKGTYRMVSLEDGANADRHGSDFVRRESSWKEGEPVKIRLAPGGGWVAVLKPAAQK